jgi:hypothetical protein
MSLTDYLQLLDWTAREVLVGKRGSTPQQIPPILDRLSLEPEPWCAMARDFGRLFFNVAGRPHTVDQHRSPVTNRRFHLRSEARQMLATST